jgi:hypothetical protein
MILVPRHEGQIQLDVREGTIDNIMGDKTLKAYTVVPLIRSSPVYT